jgi:nucleotide-binding universal stress UspA family protein
MKIKKILVPVDFSENSLNALRYAAAFAKSSGAALFILHVADPDALENELKGNLSPDHMLGLLKESEFLAGIKSTVIFRKGAVSPTILDESHKNDIDLVVMGTQGAGNMKRNLVGTHTTHVIQKSECPVLAVPAEATYNTVRKAVLAVDLEHRSDHLVEELVLLLKIQNAAILLTYVGSDPDGTFERDLQKLSDDLKERTSYQRILCKVIRSDRFPEDLETFALDIEADMLIMITHHRFVFESIFDPSKTRRYAYHTTIPLLAVPHHKTPVFFFS